MSRNGVGCTWQPSTPRREDFINPKGELLQKRMTMKYFIPALCLAFTFGVGAANAEMKPAKEPESLRSAEPKPFATCPRTHTAG